MLAEPEHYKGIVYIRISALAVEQKENIQKSFDRSMIVKILKENSLINDCILYNDYLKWFKQFNSSLTDRLLESVQASHEFISVDGTNR